MITFLLVVQIIVAVGLVGVILMQRSEGGGLGIGGSPAGLMSARGAADFLTRTTTILAALFIALSIAMAAVAASSRSSAKLDTSLVKATPANGIALPTGKPAPDTSLDPLAAIGNPAAGNATAPFNPTAPAPAAATPTAPAQK